MLKDKLCLVVDVTNIKAEGGFTHTYELFNAANPDKFGFNKVIILSSNSTLLKLSHKDWLVPKSHIFLNHGIILRSF